MDADRGVARPVPRSRMTRGRTLTIGGIAIALALAVTVTAGGCARAGETGARSDLTLTEAKAETQALESSIADVFRSDHVASVEQRQEGVLLSCTEDLYRWTGALEFTLPGALSDRDVAERLADALDSRDGWSSEVQAWETGGPTAVVSGPQGLSFVGNVDEDRHVTIASASRCVALSGDESPFSTY
ncbi:hypothetical protein [uncultured Frigoribacterium sp.]|uniref:hypothetical protein n=1 Tax=uncultured Frigoribacterium sp. TaxID=335377 RepID=UPI0028D250E9|nr:hypothetical protein [uncultured Frigoribacterium sp.]